MIELQKVHKEMNTKVVQEVADDAFKKMKTTTKVDLNKIIEMAFRRSLVFPTTHQKLAVEAMLMIKLDTLMKEVRRVTLSSVQCSVCKKYYNHQALGRCCSCDALLCSECYARDDKYNLTICLDCIV